MRLTLTLNIVILVFECVEGIPHEVSSSFFLVNASFETSILLRDKIRNETNIPNIMSWLMMNCC